MASNPNESEEQFRKVFIGGLALNTTEETLKDYLSKYGTIVDIVVMKDAATKRSRGFGFVTFDVLEGVDKVMADRPHTIDEKVVDVKRAVPRDKSSNPESNLSVTKLYVSGVKPDHNEEVFREYFKKFGNVQEVDVIIDKNTGKPRGFAFITFDDFDAVDKCCLYKSHHVNNHRCDVKKALSKDEMAKMERIRMEREWRMGGDRRFGPPFPPAYGGWSGGYDGYGGYDAYSQSYQGYQGGYGAPGGNWGGPGGGGGGFGHSWVQGGGGGSGWSQGGNGNRGGGGGSWGGGYGNSNRY